MPSISDYYRSALAKIEDAISQAGDADVLEKESDSWADYFVAKYALEPIEEDASRTIEGEESEVPNSRPGHFDIMTGAPMGATRSAILIFFPVVATDTLNAIWDLRLTPNTYSMSRGYPIGEYRRETGSIIVISQPSKEAIDGDVRRIREEIHNYNLSINEGNTGFRDPIIRSINTAKSRLAEKHSHLDQLAAATGFKLKKKSDVSAVVPTAPKVRTKILPIIRTATAGRRDVTLDPKTFEAILQLIDSQCRQFERTPASFHVLSEEGLRDVLLSSLNAVFEGGATGESFRGLGKADIHLPMAGGDAFVAEVKFWGGPNTLRETVEQLRGRLTWRDTVGVAIMLSENANFASVLESVKTTLPTVPGFAAGQPVREVGGNRFIGRFQLRTSEGHHAEIHVLVYTLYAPPGSVKRVTRGAASN